MMRRAGDHHGRKPLGGKLPLVRQRVGPPRVHGPAGEQDPRAPRRPPAVQDVGPRRGARHDLAHAHVAEHPAANPGVELQRLQVWRDDERALRSVHAGLVKAKLGARLPEPRPLEVPIAILPPRLQIRVTECPHVRLVIDVDALAAKRVPRQPDQPVELGGTRRHRRVLARHDGAHRANVAAEGFAARIVALRREHLRERGDKLGPIGNELEGVHVWNLRLYLAHAERLRQPRPTRGGAEHVRHRRERLFDARDASVGPAHVCFGQRGADHLVVSSHLQLRLDGR